MKMKFVLLLIYSWVILLFITIKKQDNDIKRVEHELKNVSIQIEQSEARVERMTDACIDIIANRRWENGE